MSTSVSAFFSFVSLLLLCNAQDTIISRKIIMSDKVPPPLSYYSQAVQVENTLYISGNIGMTTDGMVVNGVANQTRLALDNIGFLLEAAGVTFNNVVQVTVMLTNIQDYAEMNSVYGEYFTKNAPARAAFAITSLPKDALVEIEAVAVVGKIEDHNDIYNSASWTQSRTSTILCTILSLILL